jgi:hemolysin activation/secretion protein
LIGGANASTLGGSDDLRGYRNFRFHDNNALLMNAEYRWEVAPALDMAIFADAGRVFSRPEAFALSDLKAAGGFGFRFKTRDAVVLRFDTGFSSEGFQIWFKFNGPFPGLFHNIF